MTMILCFHNYVADEHFALQMSYGSSIQEVLNFDGLLPSHHQVYVENTVRLSDVIELFRIHIETDFRTPFEFRKLSLSA